MSDLEALVALMHELEERLVACMRCGMCQAVCPLFEQTGQEIDVARGKLALLDGLMKELLDNPGGVAERLDRCLLCGSCAANCPSGVSTMEIFLKARAILAGYMGLAPAQRLVLRGMLAHPRLFDRFGEWAAVLQKLFTRPANAVAGTSCARTGAALVGPRHFTALAPRPFHRQVPALDTRPDAGGPRVAFFVGCLIDKFYPRVARATLDVLAHHRVGVLMPAGQGCCGIPALSAGDTATFEKLLEHNLKRFESGAFEVLITACATCTATIREIWPLMTAERPATLRRRVADLAAKTMDVSQFLVARAGVAAAGGDDTGRRAVTYHDPCHLKKTLGIAAEPRTLIRANPDCRLVEMTAPDRCCGMGGSFNLYHYDLSALIGNRKREEIAATGAATVATGCPACMLQLADMLSQAGDRMAVQHPIEIYAQALRNRDGFPA